MRHPENYKGRHGFTLVELMVVMAILMILISLLLPSVSRALHRARTTQCMGNLRKIITAAHMYADDHGDRFPLAYQWVWGHGGGVSWANPRNVPEGLLFPYADRNEKVFLCPEFVRVYKLQPAVAHHTAHFSYSMNEYFGGGWHQFQATRATIIAPSELGLFADENPFFTPYNNWIINNPMLGVGNYGNRNHHVDAIGSFHNPLSDNLSSGNGHGNVAFADGSVRLEHSKDSKEIFTPEIVKRRFR